MHLMLNYRAVRAVKLRTLNKHRANVVFSHFWDQNCVLTPEDVAKRESIFDRGMYRSNKDFSRGLQTAKCDFGTSLQILTAHLPRNNCLSELTSLFHDCGYLLWYSNSPKPSVFVVLKEGVSAQEQLKAWYHGFLLVRLPSESYASLSEAVLLTLKVVQKTFNAFSSRLKEAGWDLELAVLETNSGTRIVQISK
jgi:hypothetical protein